MAYRGLIAGLGALVLALFSASLLIGPAAVGLGESVAALLGLGGSAEATMLVMQEIRLPRAILGLTIGASLGLSGAALQGYLRNPLAEPGLIGVSASAALGAVLAIYTGLSAAFPLALPLAALGAALVAVLLLLGLAFLPKKGPAIWRRAVPHESLRFVFLSPDYHGSTREARAALPDRVPRGAAVSNAARLPLLFEALVRGDVEHLAVLTEDRLHEPYREKIYRNTRRLRTVAREAGAAAVVLSGAGPTLMAIATPDTAEAVSQAWQSALSLCDGGTIRTPDVDPEGASVSDLAGAV